MTEGTGLAADADLIEIPNDLITVGVDKDGTPMAVPTDKARTNGAAQNGAEPAPVKTVPSSQLEAALAVAEDERRKREAAEAAVVTERTKLGETEKKLGATTTQALNAHYHKTLSDYRSVYSEYQQLQNAILSTDTLATTKEQEYARASEAGDHVRTAAIARELAKLEADRSTMESGKAAVERQLQDVKGQYDYAVAAYSSNAKASGGPVVEPDPVVQPQRPQVPTADDMIAASPAATRPWLKEHREFATPGTKEYRRLMRFVDQYMEGADDDQKALNTPEFIQALNDQFFPEGNEMADAPKHAEPTVATPAAPARRAMPSAPVSRSSGEFSSSNLNASKVRAPADVAAFCKASGLNLNKYIEAVVEEIRTGQKPKEWLDPGYDRGIR